MEKINGKINSIKMDSIYIYTCYTDMIMIKPKNDNKNDNKKEMEKREKILGKELEKNNIKFPMHVSEFDKHTKFFMDYSLQNKTIYFMFSNKAGQGWLVISNGTENVYASKNDVMDVITSSFLKNSK